MRDEGVVMVVMRRDVVMDDDGYVRGMGGGDGM